jgi:Tfp pilus assembly protein PilX
MLKFFKKIKKIKFKNQKKGIALVIAVTTMTLLLSISLSISNILLRQIKITALTNSSKPAFFTADSAVECAFYYDTLFILDPNEATLEKNINDDIATAVFGDSPNTGTIVKCGDGAAILNLVKTQISSSPKTILTTFDVDYGNQCAKVEVTRTDVDTKITSRGYNTGATPSGCDLTNLGTRRLVERGLTITY